MSGRAAAYARVQRRSATTTACGVAGSLVARLVFGLDPLASAAIGAGALLLGAATVGPWAPGADDGVDPRVQTAAVAHAPLWVASVRAFAGYFGTAFVAAVLAFDLRAAETWAFVASSASFIAAAVVPALAGAAIVDAWYERRIAQAQLADAALQGESA